MSSFKVFAAARKKGLEIKKNQFTNGYNVSMPNGTNYHAKDDVDLISYVKDY